MRTKHILPLLFIFLIFSGCDSDPKENTKTEEEPIEKEQIGELPEELEELEFPETEWDFAQAFEDDQQMIKAVDYGYAYYAEKLENPHVLMVTIDLGQDMKNVAFASPEWEHVKTMMDNAVQEVRKKANAHIPVLLLGQESMLLYAYTSSPQNAKAAIESYDFKFGTVSKVETSEDKDWQKIEDYVK